MKHKIIFHAMYVLSFMTILTPNTCLAKTKQSKNTPGTAIFVMANVNEINIQTINLNYNTDDLKLNIAIPQIDYPNKPNSLKKLNKKLLSDAKDRKAEMIKITKAYNKDIITDGLQPIPFEYLQNYSIIDSPAPYYTIEIFKYQYSGGAHGMSQYEYITLNETTGESVALKDLFKENIDYKKVINESIKKQIAERQSQGEFFFSGSDGFVSISEHQAFFVNTKGEIVIVFNVYEIAPYASGVIYFVIPKNEVATYIK